MTSRRRHPLLYYVDQHTAESNLISDEAHYREHFLRMMMRGDQSTAMIQSLSCAGLHEVRACPVYKVSNTSCYARSETVSRARYAMLIDLIADDYLIRRYRRNETRL